MWLSALARCFSSGCGWNRSTCLQGQITRGGDVLLFPVLPQAVSSVAMHPINSQPCERLSADHLAGTLWHHSSCSTYAPQCISQFKRFAQFLCGPLLAPSTLHRSDAM